MADRGLVEHFSKNGWYVGGSLGHGLAYRCILHGFEKRVGLIAGLYPPAQGFGFLDPGFDGGMCGSARADQDNRTHLILDAFGLLFLLPVLDLSSSGDGLLAA